MTARFRHSSAVPLAGVVGLLCTVALGSSRWWLTPLFLVPLGVAGWGWRAGVDADESGLVVRGLLGRRQLPWSRVDGFTTSGRTVSVQLTDGAMLRLPAVAPADLPKLLTAGGQDLHRGEQDAAGTDPSPRDPAQ